MGGFPEYNQHHRNPRTASHRRANAFVAQHYDDGNSSEISSVDADVSAVESEVASIQDTLFALVNTNMPLTDFVIHDAVDQRLPDTPAADDMGLDSGTFLTDRPTLRAAANNNVVTQYARFLFPIPPHFVKTSQTRFSFSVTELSAANVSADIDCEIVNNYVDPTLDICTTAAQSIVGSTLSAKLFNISTSGTLIQGQVLDVRIAITIDDTGGSGAEYDISAANFQFIFAASS